MFADKAAQGPTFFLALPPCIRLWRPKASTTSAYGAFLSPRMLRACPLLPGQMRGYEAGWSKLLWSGPISGCSHLKGASRGRWRGQGLGRGCSLVGGPVHVWRTLFQSPPTWAGRVLFCLCSVQRLQV